MNADAEWSLSEAERLGFSIASDPDGPLAVAVPSNEQIVASILPARNDASAQHALTLVQVIAMWATEDEDRSIFELLSASLKELRRRVGFASSETQAALAGYLHAIGENVVPHARAASKALSCIESNYPGSHTRFLSGAAG